MDVLLIAILGPNPWSNSTFGDSPPRTSYLESNDAMLEPKSHRCCLVFRCFSASEASVRESLCPSNIAPKNYCRPLLQSLLPAQTTFLKNRNRHDFLNTLGEECEVMHPFKNKEL